jgi:hypothetical protein
MEKLTFTRACLSYVIVIMVIMCVPLVESLCQMVIGRIPGLKHMLTGVRGFLWPRLVASGNKDEGPKCKVPKIGISRNGFSKEKPVDQLHESVDRIGVASPRLHRGLHGVGRQGLIGARPSGRFGSWRLAARVATGRA